jgi:hypothetical protein
MLKLYTEQDEIRFATLNSNCKNWSYFTWIYLGHDLVILKFEKCNSYSLDHKSIKLFTHKNTDLYFIHGITHLQQPNQIRFWLKAVL